MLKGEISQRDDSLKSMSQITLKNIWKYMKKNMTELKGEIDKSTVIVGDFYIPLSAIQSKQKK